MARRTEKGNAPEGRSSEALSEETVQQKGFNVSNSTQVAPIRAITVPFHGADLYVVEHDGQPYTPMRPIVEGMGLTWPSQFRKLTANKDRWAISVMETPLQGVSESETPLGGVQRMLAMPLRKLPGWLASIESGKVKNPEARARVIQYQNECDDVLWQYWNDGIAINPRAAYSVNPGDVLTKQEADTLRQMVEGMAKKLSPDTKVQGRYILQAWSKLKSHFRVGYRQIPRQELAEAVSIVTRHAVEWELVDEAPKAGAVNALVSDWVKKVESPNGYPAALFLPLVEAVQRKMGKRMVDLAPGKIIVDRRKLAAIWVDLGRLRQRLDGLGTLESDLPPSWWDDHAISSS